MLPILLREECQAVAVASVDKNKEQRRLSDELKKRSQTNLQRFWNSATTDLHGFSCKPFQKWIIVDGWTNKNGQCNCLLDENDFCIICINHIL